MPQTIEQQRAFAAWEAVGANPSEKYETLLQGVPAAIHTAGLGQTIAFYLTRKARTEYADLLTHLAEWVVPRVGNADTDADTTPSGLMKAIQECESQQFYRRFTTETLAYLGWLKRFASARLLDAKQEARDA